MTKVGGGWESATGASISGEISSDLEKAESSVGKEMDAGEVKMGQCFRIFDRCKWENCKGDNDNPTGRCNQHSDLCKRWDKRCVGRW